MTIHQDHLIIKSALKQSVERTPVWVMRQAGRYLPEYREVRQKAGNFLNLCMDSDMATEVSIQPIDLVGVDAVIMFSDILTPLMGMGMDLTFNPAPKFANPVRTEADIDRLELKDPDEATPYVGEILRKLQQQLNGRVPVIGFAGAPFTLACYMVEGKGSKLFSLTKTMFWDKPAMAKKLMDKLTRMTIDYLKYQIDNGAQLIQLFDSWAGILSPEDHAAFALPYTSQIFEELGNYSDIPKIYYINGSHHLLQQMASSGADVVSLDWTTDIAEAKELIGDQVALQGNLDPNILFCNEEVIEEKVADIINKVGKGGGHIFNLGHGIDKNVNPDRLRYMVNAVKRLSAV